MNEETSNKNKVSAIFRDIFSAFIWLYCIVKLFIYDADVYFFHKYLPNQQWLIDFKFIVLLVLVTIYWLTVGNKHFYKSFFFLLVFPLYLIFWRIGKLVFKNWFTALAVISYVSSFFSSIKFNFMTFTLFIGASTLILSSSNNFLISLGICLLFIFLFLQFGRRVYFAFIPSKALVFPRQGYARIVNLMINQYSLSDEIKNTEVQKLNVEQQNKRIANLQFLIIINRVTSFIAIKLREFQESKLMLLYFIFGLLFTLCSTVILFAFVNYGVQKIDPMAFNVQQPKSVLFFLYYSFNTILTNGIADFYPLSSFARLLSALELLFGFFIVVILFFMYTNIKNDKAKEEMDNVVNSLNTQSEEIEKYISQEYSTGIEEAIIELEKIPGSFIKIIYYFTNKQK